MLEKDQSSYLRNQPGWRPFLPSATEGDFTMPDLIAFTGHGLDVIGPPGRPGGGPGGPGGPGSPNGPGGPPPSP